MAELIKNGSFESLSGSFLSDTTADPGTMTLVQGSNVLRDWSISSGPIAVMNNLTTRVNPYKIRPPGPDAGKYFLDLTANGARPNGAIMQFIETQPGWYQVSLVLGMNDTTYPTGGPVAVDVRFFSLANHLLGSTWFRLDRGEIGYTDDGQWKIFTDEVFLVDDKSALENVDEYLLDFIARLHQAHADPRKTKIVIAAHDMSAVRKSLLGDAGNPSKFVGIDMVSVKRLDKPMPGWWRQK